MTDAPPLLTDDNAQNRDRMEVLADEAMARHNEALAAAWATAAGLYAIAAAVLAVATAIEDAAP